MITWSHLHHVAIARTDAPMAVALTGLIPNTVCSDGVPPIPGIIRSAVLGADTRISLPENGTGYRRERIRRPAQVAGDLPSRVVEHV